MERSEAVVSALLTFYQRMSTGDVDQFDATVSKHPAAMMCGTAPDEVVRDRDRLRFGFETEGVTLTAGTSPEGWAEGDLGWAFDEPLFGFPDGSSMRVRATLVFLREGGTWRVVHGHFSAGVPDDEVVALQRQWNIT